MGNSRLYYIGPQAEQRAGQPGNLLQVMKTNFHEAHCNTGTLATSVPQFGHRYCHCDEYEETSFNIQLGQFSMNPPRLLLEVGGTST